MFVFAHLDSMSYVFFDHVIPVCVDKRMSNWSTPMYKLCYLSRTTTPTTTSFFQSRIWLHGHTMVTSKMALLWHSCSYKCIIPDMTLPAFLRVLI